MRHYYRYSFPLFALLLFVLLSCKKEVYPPDVEILNPIQGEKFAFGDTLKIRAQARNAGQGMQVSLQYNNQPVGLPGITIYEDNSEVLRELYYTNRYLSSGTYEVKVTARNSETFRSAFRSVQIKALPMRQKGWAYLSKAGLHLIDSAGAEQVVALSKNFAQLAFAGRPQQIALRAKDGSKIQFYKPKTATQSEAIFAESGREIIDLQVQDGIFYLLRDDGEVSAYRDAQRLEFRYRLPLNYRAENMAIGKDGLVVIASRIGSSRRELFYFIKQQSLAVQQQPLARLKTFLHPWNNGDYLLAYTTANSTELLVYSPQNNRISNLTRLNVHSVNAMLRKGAEGMYLRTDVKVLQIMNSGTPQPVEVLNFAPQAWGVSQTDGYLYFADNNLIQRRVNGRNEFVTAAVQPINALAIIYNK